MENQKQVEEKIKEAERCKPGNTWRERLKYMYK
jgi:hypothetical protein